MIRPLHSNVLIRPDKQDEEQNGIVLPGDSVEMRKFTGVVLDVGPGIQSDQILPGSNPPTLITVPVTIPIGSRVVYSKYGGTEIEDPDDRKKHFLIVPQNEIIAVIE